MGPHGAPNHVLFFVEEKEKEEVYICTWITWKNTYIYMFIYKYIYISICKYIQVYISINKYTYIYMDVSSKSLRKTSKSFQNHIRVARESIEIWSKESLQVVELLHLFHLHDDRRWTNVAKRERTARKFFIGALKILKIFRSTRELKILTKNRHNRVKIASKSSLERLASVHKS